MTFLRDMPELRSQVQFVLDCETSASGKRKRNIFVLIACYSDNETG